MIDTISTELILPHISFAKGLQPREDITMDIWADRYRKLPQVSSSESGQWRTDRFPFLREIMLVLSPESSYRTVVVMKGSQLGFTECALNMIMYDIQEKPCPILYVQKTIDAVKRFSKQRLQPSIDLCPEISKLVSPVISRDSSNTIQLKSFPGGILILGGANSAASLRSMPIQDLILDEEESYEDDIDEEGSPSDLAIKRTTNFPRRKIFRLSTPGMKETSKIEPLYLLGDQRQYKIPCPGCGFYQVIYWRHIKYDNDDPTSARFKCEECGGEFDENFKTVMLENGYWEAKFPGRRIASFHISALYSPVGFYSWEDAVDDWLMCQEPHQINKLQVFINTTLAETFTQNYKQLSATGLLKRKEVYDGDMPETVLVLTAGCDVQEDRIECEIIGWGAKQESWSIDYVVLMGDTESTFVWEQLDQYLLRTWKHPKGIEMNLACVGVDSGHRAKVVYNFCKSRFHRRIFPVKGKSGWGQGYIRRPKKPNEHGVMLFLIFVDEIKSKIYSYLKLKAPGPGYCHFPVKDVYDKNYFKSLTSEKLVTKHERGKKRLLWELPAGHRNEALDCRCYGLAALNILNPNFELLDKLGPMHATNVKVRRKGRGVVSRGV